MPFHCASKTIPSEISVLGDYLRLEGNERLENLPDPRGFDQSYLPRGREFEQKICPGARIWPVSENLPCGCPAVQGALEYNMTGKCPYFNNLHNLFGKKIAFQYPVLELLD